ncbi:hypothetical protein MMC18_004817 [Xylographa bjoerkii]|nr:hypothetical protein [Xylographa bjoerkii]
MDISKIVDVPESSPQEWKLPVFPSTAADLKQHRRILQTLESADRLRLQLLPRLLIERHGRTAADWIAEALIPNQGEDDEGCKNEDVNSANRVASGDFSEEIDVRAQKEKRKITSSRAEGAEAIIGSMATTMTKNAHELATEEVCQKNRWFLDGCTHARCLKRNLQRLAQCKQCGDEVNIETGEGICQFHPSNLDYDQDDETWDDWEHDHFGDIDTEENHKEYPQAFHWTCCNRDAEGEGRESGKHMRKERDILKYLGDLTGMPLDWKRGLDDMSDPLKKRRIT